MREFAAAHTYLWFSLLLLAICLALLWWSRERRKEVVLSAACSAPFGFLSVFFVPCYWDPVRMVEFGAGFEDLIFSFAGGGIVWATAGRCCSLRSPRQIRYQRLLLTCLTTTAIGLLLAQALYLAGLPAMTITYLGFLAAIAIFLALRPDFWRLAAIGAAAYGLIYTLYCSVFFGIKPDFLTEWTLDALSGRSLAGVPVEEIGWSIGFGAVWSLIIGFGLDVRTDREAAPIRSQPAE